MRENVFVLDVAAMVKMNSKLLRWNFVITTTVWTAPDSVVDFVCRRILTMQCNPMLRLVLFFFAEIHINRKLVLTSIPRSPVLPFVSSTSVRVSMATSPLRSSKSTALESKRMSRSCHMKSLLTFEVIVAGFGHKANV